MSSSIKVRENRLRRMADRQGLRLMKSRRRDPRALDFGTYWLVEPLEHGPGLEPAPDILVFGSDGKSGERASLDDIEAFLTATDRYIRESEADSRETGQRS